MLGNMIEGLQILTGATFEDSRGSFSRLYDSAWLANLDLKPKQVNISRNAHPQTLRGMHYQISGEPEHKIMTLLSGSIFLAIVDLRKESATYFSVAHETFSAKDAVSIFIPAGCASGWLSSSPNTDVHYVMYSRFEDNTYGGLHYSDPTFNIPWPENPKVISDQDKNWPLFTMET